MAFCGSAVLGAGMGFGEGPAAQSSVVAQAVSLEASHVDGALPVS